MARAKKNKDFQKVKLKVGRTVRRGLNITSTKFKSRKIKIVSQFKQETSEPTTHRKQTTEELLKKCSHRNATVCQESIIGVKELISTNKELIRKHLPALIKQISETVLNGDAIVRQCGLSVFSIIFNTVTEEEIVPFFSILNSHLCCAMTHIDTRIRRDSLKLLELLLCTLPSLICSSTKVLSNFLDQISVQKHDISSIAGKFKDNRTLSVSPSDRLSAQDWRTRVFTTLAKFLKAIIENIALKENVPVTLSDLGFPQFMKCSVISTKNLCESNDLKNFINILMPLLFDTWLEAAPRPVFGQNSAEVVSAEAAQTMNCVLQVMALLLEWISIVDKNHNGTALMDWFKDNFSSIILKRCMLSFPYSQRITVKKKKQYKRTAAEVTCLSVNLTICDMFSILMLNNDGTNTKLRKKFMKYLLYLINRDSGKNPYISALVKIMKRTVKYVKPDDIKQHLLGLFNFYKKLEFGQFEKEQLLKFFEDLNTNFKTHSLAELPALQFWAQFLPDEIQLMAENNFTDSTALSVMQTLAVISNPFFLNAMQNHIASIIAFLQCNDEKIQKIMVGFIYRLPDISFEVFLELSRALQNPAVGCRTVCSLLDLLNSRVYTLKDSTIIPGHYASFLFCVAIGMLKSDEEDNIIHRQEFHEQVENVPFHLSDYSIIPSNNIERQLKITKAAIRCLKQFPDTQNTVQCMSSYFGQFALECTCLPVHTGLAFLSLEAEVNNGACAIETLNFLSELCIALLIYEYAIDILNETKEDETSCDERVFSSVCSLIKAIGNIGHIFDILSVKLRENPDLDQAICVTRILLALFKENLVTSQVFMPNLEALLSVLKNFFDDRPEYRKWWDSMMCKLGCYLNIS